MKQFEQKVSDIIDTMHILYDEFNVNKLQLTKTEWKLYEPYYYLLEHDLFFNHILTENTGNIIVNIKDSRVGIGKDIAQRIIVVPE